MDPFGRYDRRSNSDEFRGHQRSFSAAFAGERHYGHDARGGYGPYKGGSGYGGGGPPPPHYGHGYYGHHHHDGCSAGCLDRRTRRRLRTWFFMLVLAGFIGFFAFRKMGGISVKGRIAEVAFENIFEDILGGSRQSALRPEMIVPPDAAPKSDNIRNKSAVIMEKEQPPVPEDRDLTESDPLDIPLVRQAVPAAAEKLANALLTLGQSNDNDNDKDPTQLVDQKVLEQQAVTGTFEPIADFQKLLGLGETSLKRLNEQIEELNKKLSSQNQMVEELQKSLEKSEKQQQQQQQQQVHYPPKQSTMAEDVLNQLGIKSKEGGGGPPPSGSPQSGAKRVDMAEPVPFSRPITFSNPPISTVACHGSDTVDRVCKVRNLCYDPTKDRFFIFKDSATLEMYVPSNRSYLVDTTSIDGHNKFFFDFAEVHPETFRDNTVEMVDRLTFMISRFHALNIMHTIHDDFLGLYGLHRIFAPNDDPDERFPFSRGNHILFLDSFENIRYDYIFQFLTDNPLQFRQRLHENHKGGRPICFRDAVVGNSKIGSWYSYGFLEPQGPIANKTVSGLYIRDAAHFLMNRMHMPNWDERLSRSTIQELYLRKLQREKEPKAQLGSVIAANEQVFITVFSRQLDRLIVNEAELITGLQERFGLPVKTVRMEDMHLGQQVAILRSTAIAIGVHGSALILSIFLPPGAILIELFPYAVPAENYTPYRTLANLPGMRIAYQAWTNRKAENNFPHAERPPSGGGISHLSLIEQEKIKNTLTVPPHLCCRDPYWLYRIYQDTKVDLPELFSLIEETLPESIKLLDIPPQAYVNIRPGVIDSVRCKVQVPPGIDATRLDNSTKLDVEISWDEPWNGVVPDKYGVWIHQPYQELFSTRPLLIPPQCVNGSKYDIWVRSYVTMPGSGDVIKSQYSEKFICPCVPGGVAKNTEGSTDL